MPGAGIALLPLAIGLTLLVVMTVLPSLATDRQGHADHTSALLIFWAMSAGFVRGVGFIPKHRLARWILSGGACLLTLMAALVRLYGSHRLAIPF